MNFLNLCRSFAGLTNSGHPKIQVSGQGKNKRPSLGLHFGFQTRPSPCSNTDRVSQSRNAVSSNSAPLERSAHCKNASRELQTCTIFTGNVWGGLNEKIAVLSPFLYVLPSQEQTNKQSNKQTNQSTNKQATKQTNKPANKRNRGKSVAAHGCCKRNGQ